MPNTPNRRTFLKQSAAAVALPAAISAATSTATKQHYICVTCGMQYAETDTPPSSCPDL